MKYIRTENGVYAIDREGENTVIGVTPTDNFGVWIHKSDIIAQASTIEELCDEFVLFDKSFNTYGVFDKKVITYKWLKEHRTIYSNCIIYGAIWTDKGLIYVAKMNDEGKLCLI